MKKAAFLLLVLLIGTVLWAQQKFALIIGNGAYDSISRLSNPVNDANDIDAALRGLGFNVDKVLNGNLDQMETAIMNFIRKLGSTRNSYGFFFYAGHGVQSNGENYLIPVGADIQSENHLRQRAVSVQTILDNLDSAGNELNMIVLDACRDNPFGWSRGGSRGLSVVSHAPPGSIILYATSANSTAADGTGRNGLFTSQLLNNLKTPGLSVRDMFDKTGEDVLKASGGKQHPELSLRFFGASSVYLGTRPSQPPVPAPAPVVTPTPAPQPAPVPVVQPVAPPIQTTPAYQIGDQGPAGGIIFYDKGSYSEGWRYLEAASQDIFTAWGLRDGNVVNGTLTNIGSGKQNTKLIIEQLSNENFVNAAKKCFQYSQDSFSDWFLPSKDELELLYKNLHKIGLGGFNNTPAGAWYWSSSQNNENNSRAYGVYFRDGNPGSSDKGHNGTVRAIRSF